MAIKIDQIQDVAVVAAKGMFRGGPETDELDAALKKLMVEEGRRKVLLDLSATAFLGSSSIGVIGAAHGHARDHKLNFWTCGMTPRVQTVFGLMKFGPELRRFETAEEALKAFQNV